MLSEVRLYGELRRQFGATHRFDVATPAEAIRALCANFRDFERHLIVSGERGVAYAVKVGAEFLDEAEQFAHPTGRQVIRIAPAISGAKSGLFQVFEGVALVALAWATAGTSLMAASLVGGMTVGGMVTSLGISLALGGIAQMLAPQPKTPGPANAAGHDPSYAFNGPVNTSAQGNPVPIGYGRLIVGSATVSAGISVSELQVPPVPVTGLQASIAANYTVTPATYTLRASWAASSLASTYLVTWSSDDGKYTGSMTTGGATISVAVAEGGPYTVTVIAQAATGAQAGPTSARATANALSSWSNYSAVGGGDNGPYSDPGGLPGQSTPYWGEAGGGY